jgi:hypothetical protein
MFVEVMRESAYCAYRARLSMFLPIPIDASDQDIADSLIRALAMGWDGSVALPSKRRTPLSVSCRLNLFSCFPNCVHVDQLYACGEHTFLNSKPKAMAST